MIRVKYSEDIFCERRWITEREELAVNPLEFLSGKGSRGTILEETYCNHPVKSGRSLIKERRRIGGGVYTTFVPLLELFLVKIGYLLELIKLCGGELRLSICRAELSA